uniref:Putative zinc finger, RING-CH-type, Zinc finger, RING/FYVE/PHD-type n=1 Tax=Helianthus annuus TaxID=4232 RepID=A0A251TYI9_HELAN
MMKICLLLKMAAVFGGTGERCNGHKFLKAQLDLEAKDHSRRHSTAANIEIVGAVVSDEEEKGRESTVSDFSIVDLESGGGAAHNDKVHWSKIEGDCRICHLSIDLTNQDSKNGSPIELGCSCKDDLAVAHKYCAEAWFKIKGGDWWLTVNGRW